jgi:signal recognition particle subunit SRP19
MAQICQMLCLPCAPQNKTFPRDLVGTCRVKVMLAHDDGTPINPAVPTRKALMLQMGEKIPRLKIRTDRLKKEEEAKQLAMKRSGGGTASTGSSKKKGKKGKKGRR